MVVVMKILKEISIPKAHYIILLKTTEKPSIVKSNSQISVHKIVSVHISYMILGLECIFKAQASEQTVCVEKWKHRRPFRYGDFFKCYAILETLSSSKFRCCFSCQASAHWRANGFQMLISCWKLVSLHLCVHQNTEHECLLRVNRNIFPFHCYVNVVNRKSIGFLYDLNTDPNPSTPVGVSTL